PMAQPRADRDIRTTRLHDARQTDPTERLTRRPEVGRSDPLRSAEAGFVRERERARLVARELERTPVTAEHARAVEHVLVRPQELRRGIRARYDDVDALGRDRGGDSV